MRISHEIPLAYLNQSRQFNDYDYALVHLFDTEPKYLQFFKESIAMGRTVLLDNSAYEIFTHKDLYQKYNGYYPMDRYKRYISELRPTEYVLPDVKDKFMENIEVIIDFYNENIDLPGRKIGVIHGGNFQELQDSYDTISKLVDKVAVSFEGWWFDWAKQNNIPVQRIRFEVLSRLKLNPIIPMHLLGCILPGEFLLWKGNAMIESIDTSAPVTNALEGITFNMNTNYKPQTTIHSAFNVEWNETTAELINHNVNIFKTSLL